MKTVIVDKDMKEIVALQKVRPQASVEICKFHVLQAITRDVRKKICTQEIREKVLPIFIPWSSPEMRNDMMKP